METVEQKLSQFVSGLRLSDLTDEVIEKGKTCLLCGIGIGMANRNMPNPRAAFDLVRKYDPGETATLVGCGGKASLMGAVFANAVAFHARGQEDTHGTSHLGTVVIPSALAMAEKAGATGEQFLLSVVAGYEVGGALGRDLTALSTERGFRASSIYGTLAAAATVSKILGYDPERTKNALGMAASFACGNTEAFAAGTMEWNFENGVAARNGLLAALVAEFDIPAADTFLSGETGFCQAFAGSRSPLEEIGERIGVANEILNVTFKPYSTCAFNQTPVSAMFRLIEREDLKPEEVQGIEVRMNPYEANYPGMSYLGPYRTLAHTLMSTAFMLGVVIVHRRLHLADGFIFDDPRVLAMCRMTRVIPDESVAPLSCRLTVRLRDGKKAEERMDITPEYYCFKMEKVIEILRTIHQETGVPSSVTDELVKRIKVVESWPDVNEFVDLLTVEGG